MTTNDQPHTIPAGLTRDEAQAVREWAERARGAEVQDKTVVHAARVLLAVLPQRPTLADMTTEERAACRWMQADVANRSVRYVIVTPYDEEGDAELASADGGIEWFSPDRVTPRPDLPRLEWPGTEKPEEVAPAKVGDMIESADDPRLPNLPVGSILSSILGDCDGGVFDVTKTDTDVWDGPGYVPAQGTGTTWGPWTVRHIGKEADAAPALPEGWRLADHYRIGRVIVTNPTPNQGGHVYFVTSDECVPRGSGWGFCTPAELTYLDTEPEDDQ